MRVIKKRVKNVQKLELRNRVKQRKKGLGIYKENKRELIKTLKIRFFEA